MDKLMKKILVSVLIGFLALLNTAAFAKSEEDSIHLRDMRIQPAEPANAPRWAYYVPEKYQNPRTDFSKGKAIAELSAGVVLTELIVTAPIGVPMICHGTTKLKNVSYANKKKVFFDGIEEAKTLPVEQQEVYYQELIKKCKFKNVK